MNRQQYLKELGWQLAMRGVRKRQAELMVAEADSHLDLSGEDPVAAFGPPDQYAANLVPDRHWHVTSYIAAALPATAAGVLLAKALGAAFGDGEVAVSSHEVLMVSIIAVAVVVAGVPAVGYRIRRHPWPATLVTAAAAGLAALIGMVLFDDRTVLRTSPPVAFVAAAVFFAAALLLVIAPRRSGQ